MAKKPKCSELAATITRLALNIGSRPEIKDLDGVLAHMQQAIPELTREELIRSINEATAGHAEAKTELQKKLDALREEARNDTGLRAAIDATREHLKAGTRPAPRQRQKPDVPNQIAALRRERDSLIDQLPKSTDAQKEKLRARISEIQRHIREGTLPAPKIRAQAPSDVADLQAGLAQVQRELSKSEPAIRKRFEKQIADLTERIQDGVELPGPKPAEPPVSKDLEKLAYQRDRLQRVIRDRISALRPKTIWGRVSEPLNFARVVMTSFDLSAVLRQGGFITTGNPVRAARAFPDMFRAFGSPQASHKINAEILDRENAPLYARSGLYLSPEGESAPLGKQEEAYMSRLLEKVQESKVGRALMFPVAGSERAYKTFLNRLRADSFDTMVATLGRGGEVTQKEAEAIANFINKATGRGGLGKAENAGPALATAFFAPRYLASRFQLLAGQPLYGGTGRTRKLIAGEYAKLLAGLGVIYGLGSLAGGTIETDPRSSDFGKMKFGDTRLDPLMGMAQVTTLLAKLGTGEKMTGDGKIVPIRNSMRPMNLLRANPSTDKVPHGGQNAKDVIASFLRSKLAPVPGAVVDLLSGENAVGEPVTPADVGRRLIQPLALSDIYDQMTHEGVPKATAFSMLALLGLGVQRYQSAGDKKKAELQAKLQKNLDAARAARGTP